MAGLKFLICQCEQQRGFRCGVWSDDNGKQQYPSVHWHRSSGTLPHNGPTTDSMHVLHQRISARMVLTTCYEELGSPVAEAADVPAVQTCRPWPTAGGSGYSAAESATAGMSEPPAVAIITANRGWIIVVQPGAHGAAVPDICVSAINFVRRTMDRVETGWPSNHSRTGPEQGRPALLGWCQWEGAEYGERLWMTINISTFLSGISSDCGRFAPRRTSNAHAILPLNEINAGLTRSSFGFKIYAGKDIGAVRSRRRGETGERRRVGGGVCVWVDASAESAHAPNLGEESRVRASGVKEGGEREQERMGSMGDEARGGEAYAKDRWGRDGGMQHKAQQGGAFPSLLAITKSNRKLFYWV
ncbi:hypothetical protein B0H16DRAFT_1467604 [Mycena metata]|uniref:Uncharacterized protein n=1 Tax=Mycena metata TaxID=1033252 RepID=A0AAD7MX11_9AGAR|nr:hypothetical protein B0H16DRAFT_1467604 [Mycena metata]